jgi:pyruvate carboxylase
MDRALREFRIRGVKTNLVFLESLINNPDFVSSNYNTSYVDNKKNLYDFKPKKDRASKIISYLGHIIVNGHEEVSKRKNNFECVEPTIPTSNNLGPASNYVEKLSFLGPEKFSLFIKEIKGTLITDTTMRDAHQSLLATRMRTDDLANIANFYSKNLSELFSLECWGGATFDTSMRYQKEDPWERLVKINEKAPNLLKQMLLRGANAVGYKNYPDNVVRFFVKEAANAGIDVFRIFDSLNLIENMEVAIEEVRNAGKICEGAICYTNDVNDPNEKKYTLKYYIDLVQSLDKLGANIIAIKDMAGLCKPEAISLLVREIKNSTDLPIHFHTHDTSGTSSASVISAINEGVDIVDLAMDSMSGLTSQPPLGSIANIINSKQKTNNLNEDSIRSASLYWEEVRQNYIAFETDFKGGSSDVYLHQMPGGQFTNLKEQAKSLGINTNKWGVVVKKYADVNQMFGDIVKVTPSSKVVGDMSLYMIANDLSVADVMDPDKEVIFPQSVIEFFKGELGVPHGGFPKKLQKKILGNQEPISGRPGLAMSRVDLEDEKINLEKDLEQAVDNQLLASYLMYPKVFKNFINFRKKFGDTSVLSTPLFFYGPKIDQEYSLRIDKGKTLIVRYLTRGEAKSDGMCSIFFELNGQPRTIEVLDETFVKSSIAKIKIDPNNHTHIGSPLPGQVAQLFVKDNDKVMRGDKILIIEAMKMETIINAEKSGTIQNLQVTSGDNVDSKDLLCEIH